VISVDKKSAWSNNEVMKKLINYIIFLTLCSCSSKPVPTEKVERQVSSVQEVVDKHFPADLPFPLAKGEEKRFKKIWKRILCLHNERSISQKQENLSKTFHHKVHGCLKADFIINKNLPSYARSGIFKKQSQQSFKSWLRFSNINHTNDNMDDLRGLGAKIFYKDKSMSSFKAQDFLVNDTDRHFASEPEDIVEFTEHAVRGMEGIVAYALKDKEDLLVVFGSVEKALNLLQTNPAEFIKIINTSEPKRPFKYVMRLININLNQSDKPLSILTKEFHSRAPFSLGKKTIKYAIRPCLGAGEVPSLDRKYPHKNGTHPTMISENHLSEDLRVNAKNAKLCLELVAYFFKDEKTTPLKDYSVPWKVKPVILGTFDIEENQDIDEASQKSYCEEQLHFDIWDYVSGHAPIGPVNKGRYFIYHASQLQSKEQFQLDCSASE
jgi:hypothetical protein